jgi:hypothetical protein
MLFQALIGIEVVDKNIQTSSRDYVKSKLFWIPTLDLIRQGSYVGILAVVLAIFLYQSNSELDLVYAWAIISLGVEIPFTIFVIQIAKKAFLIKINISFFKYLLASIVIFSLIGLIMDKNLEYKESIFEFMPSVIIYGILCIIGYLGLTYLIDQRTRTLFKAIWNELFKKKN